jgi:hypothetical protein
VSEVVLDPLGMTMRFDADAVADTVKADLPANPGSWLQGGGAPAYDGADGMNLSLALDLFNRMLYAGWSAGAFDQDLSNEELALDPAAIGLIFPGATTLNLVIVPSMPPVLSPGTGDGLFDLDMDELQLVATGDVDGVEQVLTTASLHLHADLDATVDADGLISIAVENLSPTADVYPADMSSTAAAESLEATLGSLAGVLLGDLFPGIELQLPALPGYTLEPTGLEASGDALTWMTVGGTLVVD